MNMISELRQRVRQNGKAEITAEEFDKLQAEWITRAGAIDMVAAERQSCADCVPSNWCDPMLTGKAAVTGRVVDCRDIEAVLIAIKARIMARSNAN